MGRMAMWTPSALGTFLKQSLAYIDGTQVKLSFTMKVLPWILGSRYQRLLEALDNTNPPWASRAWMRQELALPRRAYLCFGRTRVQLDPRTHGVLRTVMEFGGYSNYKYIIQLLDQLWQCDQFNRRLYPLSDEEPKALTRLADENAGRVDATDARDLVYSLLGLGLPQFLPTGRSRIVPDYSKPIWQVWAETTLAMIDTDHSLRALENANIGRQSCRVQGLPSWAFDFHSFPYMTRKRDPDRYLLQLLGIPSQLERGQPGTRSRIGARSGVRTIRYATQPDPTQPSPAQPDPRYLTLNGQWLSDIVDTFKLPDEVAGFIGISSEANTLLRAMELFTRTHMSRMVDMPSTGYVKVTEHCISRPLRHLLSRVLTQVAKTPEWILTEASSDETHMYAVAANHLRWWAEETGWTRFASRELREPLDAMRYMQLRRVTQFFINTADSDTRAVASLENGLLGILAGSDLAVGDRIFLARGSEQALVVRACSDGYYQLRGLAYVEGIMQGELEVIFNGFDIQDEEIVLV
jgi:hypothetical protein